MTRLLALAAPALLASMNACMAGNINVQPVAVSAQKPGNVALLVSVSQQGSALVGLDRDAFQVFENGVRLDKDQVKLTLLPTGSADARQIALLVDMSRTLTPGDRKAMSEALRPFIVKLRQHQAVSLYAFDGAEKSHFIADYPRDARAEPDEKDTSLDRLLAFSRRDSSASLYSAVMDGAQKLSASLAGDGRPIQSGTVVVIALNPDLAGRVNDGKFRDFIADSPHHYFLLTVGTWASSKSVSFIGKNGETRAASVGTMSSPLVSLASAVDDDYFRDYLVTYCSPARAGTRQVRLQVSTRDAQGKQDEGSYQTEFDATGFGPGCNPLATPHFVVAKAKPKEATRVASAAKAPATSGAPVSAAPSVPVASVASAAPAAPAAADDNVPASAAPKPSASAQIAEPPSGLGYE